MHSVIKNIFYKTSQLLWWFAGGIFFFFLSVCIGASFLTRGLRKMFRWKELYHFREEEFPALNVMYDSGESIPVGKLPIRKGETFTYEVPIAAKEVLLEFKFTAYPSASIEFDYCLSANDSSLRKEFVYIFIHPFDSMNLNYDRALLWYPLPADHMLKVQFTGVKAENATGQNIVGHLNVVQVR